MSDIEDEKKPKVTMKMIFTEIRRDWFLFGPLFGFVAGLVVGALL